MKIPSYIEHLLSMLEQENFEAYVVGGCVRDSLLGKEPQDWDICTSAKPDEILSVFQDYTTIPTGISHGTITVLCGEKSVEITTFRQDGEYQDFRHPSSVLFVSNLYEDLSRRDFTVNAMAYHPRTGIVDPFDGRGDLEKKILRCVGVAELRFQEDALRILRALRFSAQCEFSITQETKQAIHNEKRGLTRVSGERVWVELSKLLSNEKPGEILLPFDDIFSVIFNLSQGNDILSWKNATKRLDDLPPLPALRLFALFYGILPQDSDLSLLKDSLLRLRLDGETSLRIQKLFIGKNIPLPETLSAVRRQIYSMGKQTFLDYMEWKRTELIFDKSQEELFCFITQALETIQTKKLCCSMDEMNISGNDLLQQGMCPGPELGQALTRALYAIMDEKIPNEKKSILKFLFS